MANAIVTMPPHAPYMHEVAGHPAVLGLRLNTVMPIKGNLEDALKNMQDKSSGKDVWIDLKCRQVRIATYGVPPFTEIELTHEISVDVPAKAYFHDGKESATILQVDGKRLIMQDGPKRVVGPGESINIPHPSLKISGYLTDCDKRYIDAAVKVGLHKYMISFVEGASDCAEIKSIDPLAEIVEKIESMKGMEYVSCAWSGNRLMAARGDLFMELPKPHMVISAVEKILAKDKDAIVASRLFPSLAESYEPSCQDIGDVDNLLRIGYKTFMLGDDLCMNRNSLVSALNLFEAMAERYR